MKEDERTTTKKKKWKAGLRNWRVVLAVVVVVSCICTGCIVLLGGEGELPFEI